MYKIIVIITKRNVFKYCQKATIARAIVQRVYFIFL